MLNTLPVHPTKRHPHTGQPLRAIFVRRDGRVFWPIIGASPDDASNGGGAGGDGGATGGDNGGGDGGGNNGSGGSGRTNATDAQGNDLGYPKDTPTAEMTDKEQAAYFKHNSRKHEGRLKSLIGDRTPEQVKADLEAYAQLQKEQQTPAEQALAAARDEGKKEAIASERNKAATAIFRGALEAGGIEGDDLDELVSNFNVSTYITDDGVDTTKITNFAKRFSTEPGKGKRDPDFGGGKRRQHQNTDRGSAGKAEAQKRFGKKTTSAE
jgi:hypothetical protein